MRISDVSSDVCSPDRVDDRLKAERAARAGERGCNPFRKVLKLRQSAGHAFFDFACAHSDPLMGDRGSHPPVAVEIDIDRIFRAGQALLGDQRLARSEEHTSELQSLMRNSYAVFCL